VKKVIVTGARGFLGSAVSKLLAWNRFVKLIMCSRTGEPSSTAFYNCDLSQPAEIQKMLEEIKPDEIYHCAGFVGRDFTHLFQSNVVNTANVLEAVRLHTPSARVLLNGSAASYGNVDPAHNPIPESLQPRPVTPYGFCKATQTELMRYFHSNHALHVKEARIFNLWGPGAPEHLVNGRVEMLIEQYLKGQIAEIKVGFLGAKRDYLDVETAAGMLLRIMDFGLPGEIYNVGSGRARVVRDLIKEMLNQKGVPLEVLREEGDSNTQPLEIFADLQKFNQLVQATGKK
jgi:GDP-4-dehydro-6-deoxy-D-mannose reductase